MIQEIERNLLYSPIPEQYDVKPAEIYTFIPSEHPELLDELHVYCNDITDGHRLVNNYVGHDFSNYPFVTTWKRDNKLVGFCTGWDREFYYPGSVRLLNRFWLDPEHGRPQGRAILRPSTYNCIQQQLYMADRLGYKFPFISRELRTPKHFELFIIELNNRSIKDWEYRLGPYLLAPDPGSFTCWQSIGLAVTGVDTKGFWEYWKTK